MPLKREKIFSEITNDLLAMSKVVFGQMQYVKLQLAAQEKKGGKREDSSEVLMEVVGGSEEQAFLQNELIIDSFEVKLRRNVIKSMVLHNPRANDMRKIISCYDINVNLERIGDLLLNVHEHLEDVDFEGELYDKLKASLMTMFTTAETMVSNSIICFTSEDISLALPTIEMDNKVDELYETLKEKTISMSVNRSHSAEQLRELLAISDIIYNIERIADNATNIVESSVYLIDGRNIQHQF